MEMLGLELVNFDQGRLRHLRQKPTTLATNVKMLKNLNKLRVDSSFELKPLPADLSQRISEAWAPGLKKAIVEALKCELDAGDSPSLRRMTPERWKQHLACDHMPFAKDCVACQIGAGRSKPHRRIPAPDS